MDKAKFIVQMKKLAACELTPADWLIWWNQHDKHLKTFLSRGDYLRIKPCEHQFLWVPVLTSQKGALHYLEDQCLEYVYSDQYQKNYEKEFNDYIQAQNKLRKQKIKALKCQYSLLYERYPKFASSLKYTYDDGDLIEMASGAEKVEQCETRLGVRLPGDVADFFQIVGKISLEGISIDLEDLHMINLFHKTYCVLGEFWKDGDGDLLLIDMQEPGEPVKIFYYAHKTNKIKLLSKSIADLLEKELAKYNRQQGV